MWWLWPSCVRWGGGRTRVGASERQAHVRVRACALARARKGKERRGEKRRRRGKGEHTFVCDDKDDCSSGAVTWRVAFHEFARTRRARSRDRKHALMARARRRARVEHNRQLPWLLPWQLPLPLPCRRRRRDTSVPPPQLPRPAAAPDADRGGVSTRRRDDAAARDATVHRCRRHGPRFMFAQTNKNKHRRHRGGT